jgi:uncharacterized protein (DUF1684 family)
MRLLPVALLLLLSACTPPPAKYESEIEILRVKKQAAFIHDKQSPLDSAERAQFKGLHYYAIDPSYKVKARLVRHEQMPVFQMPHTLERTYPYQELGEAMFILNGTEYTLMVYTNEQLKKENKLFIPFTDLTNSVETYGGGRYLDIYPSENASEIEIDFNQAYFPYCAYSHRFSCPLVPAQNHLAAEIRAGERL